MLSAYVPWGFWAGQGGGEIGRVRRERGCEGRGIIETFLIHWCEMESNSEMQCSDDLSSGRLWKTALFSFVKKCWHAWLYWIRRIVWQITVMVCVLVRTPAVCSQQTLGPRRLSSNDTSSIRSYQCPSHGGDFECSEALENVNVLGEKVSHSFPPTSPAKPPWAWRSLS